MLIPNTHKDLLGIKPFEGSKGDVNDFVTRFVDFMKSYIHEHDDFVEFCNEWNEDSDESIMSILEDLENGISEDITCAMNTVCLCLDAYMRENDKSEMMNRYDVYLGDADCVSFSLGYDEDELYQLCEVELEDGKFTCLLVMCSSGDDSATMTAVAIYFDNDGKMQFYIPTYGNAVFPNTDILMACLSMYAPSDYPEECQSESIHDDDINIDGINVDDLDEEDLNSLKEYIAYNNAFGIENCDDSPLLWSDMLYGWHSDCHVDFERIKEDIASNVRI